MTTATEEKTLPQLCEEFGITSTVKEIQVPETAPEWARNTSAYRITLRHNGRHLSFNFYQGNALTRKPSTADAVWTLASDYNSHQSAPTLQDFGGEFGWNEHTLATFRAVKNLAMRWEKFIGDASILETLGQVEY